MIKRYIIEMDEKDFDDLGWLVLQDGNDQLISSLILVKEERLT